jgi:DNA-binding transcriptional ArsR family regulator
MRSFTLEERARILRALGTASRMQIIEVLKQGPLDVGDLAEALGISQSAVSQHLKVLKGLGLVRDQRHSYFIAYSLDPHSFARLEQMMVHVCRISYENALRRKKYERRVRKERLLQLREHLKSQLEQVDEAIAALEEEESEKS